MLSSSLKFVQGAVGKKDFMPALTHFVIDGGRVRGFNGTMTLCSPIALDLSCKPKAEKLIHAISRCSETVSLHLTPTGKLSVKSGGFRALVDCVEGDAPHPEPEGERVEVDGGVLLQAFKVLEDFIGTDAARPWANGILLKGQSAFATNNVILCEYWTGAEFPCVVNLPRAAVKEMLRIGEAPLHLQVTDKSLTFHYEGGRWLRTQLLSTEWPDLARVLNRPHNAKPVDERLFEALRHIKPFADKMGDCYFMGGGIATHPDSEQGADYSLPDLQDDGRYIIEMLEKLEGVAKTIDFSAYPNPCLFFGDRLRGAIIGMRKPGTDNGKS